MSIRDEDFKSLRKYHTAGTSEYTDAEERQARAQEARVQAMLDMFGAEIHDVFDAYEGNTGILCHRGSGDIRRITYTSKPYRHSKYGWCIDLEDSRQVTLRSLGIVMSEEIDPDQEVAVVNDDEVNIRRLAEQLVDLNQLSIERLRTLYPELLD